MLSRGSNELTNTQAFVAMQYFGFRNPETAGYNAWLTFLNANPTQQRTIFVEIPSF